MDKHFQIGEFCFRLICERNICIPDNFLLFEVLQYNTSEFIYHLKVTDCFPSVNGKTKAIRSDLSVYEADAGEVRLEVL